MPRLCGSRQADTSMNKILLAFSLALIAFAPAAGAAPGNPVKGKQVYAKCMACHKLDSSGASMLGPNLYKIVNRPIASVKTFKYSPAMMQKKGKWTPALLDAYLASPSKAVPGNRMPFAGLSKAEDRADVIAYIVASSK